MTNKLRTLAGPPVARHVGALGLTVGVMGVFYWLSGSRDNDLILPLSHAVLADTSVVLLCLILVLGASARLIPRLRPYVPWGRELGIAMFVTAGLHVAMLFGPEVEVFRFFFRETRFGTRIGDSMAAAANWVGLFAVAIALVLTVISNDWSQRLLGRGWKFVQRHAYTLFVLVWLHTAAYVIARAGHDALLSVTAFWVLTAVTLGAQLVGFVHTVRSRRVPSPHRVPAKTSDAGRSSGLARWTAVVAMWCLFVIGSWTLAYGFIPTAEEERKASAFCQRYAEIADQNLSRDRLVEELASLPFPDDDETGTTFDEALEMCQ